jgi:GNAT superfamily N-acetyltransferase
MLLVRRYDDPAAFRDAATPYLLGDEARHNLVFGISSTLIRKPDIYELFDLWTVMDGDHVVGVALRTPPHNLVLAQPGHERALEALVDRLLQEEQELPGIVAAVPELDTFVGAWTTARDVDAILVVRHGIYELREVPPLPVCPGAARPATPDDRELVVDWIREFAREVLPEQEGDPAVRGVESRLHADDHAGLWLWEDRGEPVAISGYGGETPNGIRIGPVYTPPPLRGRGYATTLVAEQSRWLLGAGRRFCFLYTDLDNPTSNALYRRIGYRMIAESAEVRFAPKAAA